MTSAAKMLVVDGEWRTADDVERLVAENQRLREAPRFAVRISRGLVTHFNNDPLITPEQVIEARAAIYEVTGEYGEIEDVILYEYE